MTPDDQRVDDDTDPLAVAVHANAVMYHPIITKIAEHQWRAQYPGLDWYVVTDRVHDAADTLSAEAQRRSEAGAPDAQPPLNLMARHLKQAMPGMLALDRELFMFFADAGGHR